MFGENFILTPIFDLQSTFHVSEDHIFKEGITEPWDEFFDEFETNFFLNYSQKLKLKFLYKDSKIVEFYRNFLRDSIFPTMKGVEFG